MIQYHSIYLKEKKANGELGDASHVQEKLVNSPILYMEMIAYQHQEESKEQQ